MGLVRDAKSWNVKSIVLVILSTLFTLLTPIISCPLQAEEPLFKPLSQYRSSTGISRASRGVRLLQRVELSPNSSFKNFTLELHGETVRGTLNTDKQFPLTRSLVTQTNSERGTLFSLQGKRIGTFITSASGSATHSLFVSEHGHASLKVSPDGAIWEEYESELMPGCGHDEHDFSSQDIYSSRSFDDFDAITTTSAVTIDLLLLYTETAASKNGVDSLLAELQAAVELANIAFVNSAVPAQYRIVHTAMVSDSYESDMASSLSALRADAEVAALREEHGADLVSLIVGGNSHKYCGLGYVPYTPEAVYKRENGFSIVLDSCAAGNFSLAHELGHNAGLHHDAENAPKNTAYAGSYGYRFGDDAFRTVMAYAPGVRLPYFSNPDVYYSGFATGSDTANNARVLTMTTSVIAGFYSPPQDNSPPKRDESEPHDNGGNSGEETGSVPLPSAMDVERHETKKEVTFTILIRSNLGEPLPNTSIEIYQQKSSNKNTHLSTVVTGADGIAAYSTKKRRKGGILTFVMSHLPEVLVKVPKLRTLNRRRRN